MRHLKSGDYSVMPWKNGKGTTTQILIVPPTSGLAGNDFDFRISKAMVAESGSFSPFVGCDRTLVLLTDGDLCLRVGANAPHTLKRFVPFTFSGDEQTEGVLVGAPVFDFNLIWQRSRVRAIVRAIALSEKEAISLKPQADTIFLYCAEGRLRVAGLESELIEQESILIETEASAIDLLALSPTILLLCEIWKV